MTAIYKYALTVVPEELDGIGHVNNLAYIKWMLNAAIEHASAVGWTPQRHLEVGAGWVVKSHFIEYLRPAFAGEQIEVQTWVAGFKRVSSVRRYRMHRVADGVILAVAETNWAYVNFRTHSPQRIPPEVIASFEILPADAEP